MQYNIFFGICKVLFQKFYRFEEDAAPTIFPFSQDIAVGIYADLSINVAELLK